MQKQIQWFPGHMAKTRRIMAEQCSKVDFIIELLDARVPHSSKNPEFHKIAGAKPVLILLNKSSLADPALTAGWVDYYAAGADPGSIYAGGFRCIAADCVTGEGMAAIPAAARELARDKIERNAARGIAPKPLRAMVVGIPNVGKSSLINRFAGAKKARVENRPGVTREKQWVRMPGNGIFAGFELLDMPGVLWPKFDDRAVGENLAVTGAIKHTIFDAEETAAVLCERLAAMYPEAIAARYRLSTEEIIPPGYEILERIARRRGFLLSGGETDTERAANMLLDEFRAGILGRITLEKCR